jgi:hypothetical protein
MEQKAIKTVDMVRAIRDTHADELQDKSPAEIIAFYQRKARDLHQKLNLPVQPQQNEESKTTA